MTVHPLSYASGADHHSRQDLATGCLHGILAGSAGEGHVNGARDGVARQAGDGAAVLRVDWELHCSQLVDGLILDGQAAGSGAACATPATVLVVAEDRHLAVGLLARGVIVTQR